MYVNPGCLFLCTNFAVVKGDIDCFTDTHQSAYDSYPTDIKKIFMSDEEDRPEKKPKIPSTPVIFGGKRSARTPPSVSRSPIPLPVIDSAPGIIEETSERRLQIPHVMHYLDNQTGKNRTIVVFALYPGTDITQEIVKDGREVLFHIRSPHRLLAKEFVNGRRLRKMTTTFSMTIRLSA
jgi:hypothetical protein